MKYSRIETAFPTKNESSPRLGELKRLRAQLVSMELHLKSLHTGHHLSSTDFNTRINQLNRARSYLKEMQAQIEFLENHKAFEYLRLPHIHHCDTNEKALLIRFFEHCTDFTRRVKKQVRKVKKWQDDALVKENKLKMIFRMSFLRKLIFQCKSAQKSLEFEINKTDRWIHRLLARQKAYKFLSIHKNDYQSFLMKLHRVISEKVSELNRYKDILDFKQTQVDEIKYPTVNTTVQPIPDDDSTTEFFNETLNPILSITSEFNKTNEPLESTLNEIHVQIFNSEFVAENAR